MWKILELKYSSEKQAKSFLNSFKEKVQKYKLYCLNNKEKNYITKLLDTVEQQKLLRIYLNLHAQEDLRIKNGMIDIQYSYPINASLTLFEKFIDKLDNKFIPEVATNVSVNFPALYDAAKSLASMLYGRIARNSSLFFALLIFSNKYRK
jgi:hypothetical protein